MTTHDVSIKERRPIPRQVWLLSWVSFFADVSSEMIYPLLPLYMISVLGASKAQLGAMEGAAVVIVAMLSAYAGFRSDHGGTLGGRMLWIRLGYGLPVLGKSIIAIATMLPMVVLGRLLDRFGKGLRGAPRDALIAGAVSPNQRGQAFGLHRAFDTAGALVGVLISAALLAWLTGSPQLAEASILTTPVAITTVPAWVYQWIFALGAALGLASLVLTFLIRDTGSAGADAKKIESALDDLGKQPGIDLGADKLVQTTSTAIELIPSSSLRILPISYWYTLGVLVLFSLANSSDTFLLLRAADFGISPAMIVIGYATYNISYSLLAYPMGALSDQIGRWKLICFGWLIYAGVYLGFALLPTSQAWGVWILLIVYGGYMSLTEGTGKALIADHTSASVRGAALGLFHALTGLATFFSSLLAGLLWDHFGAPAAFLAGAAAALLAVGAVIVFRGKWIRSSGER